MPLIYGKDDETQVSKINYELINMFVYIKIFYLACMIGLIIFLVS